jgi:hypothetical protein
MKRYVFAILIAFIFSSCATVFSGFGSKVKVHAGTPIAAKVYLNGNYIADAPCSVKVSKSMLKDGQSKITIKAAGYKDQEIVLGRKLKAGALFGDILLLGWPIIIDFADKAIYKAYPSKINYSLDQTFQQGH